jgi:GNAT superfamily N-acetyltransferase
MQTDLDRDAIGDAWGAALLDYFDGREVVQPMLEVDDGTVLPAMRPEWFFRDFDRWDWWDRELLAAVETGPVLDLGAGAGRASLYLQGRGMAVTAIESSAGAAEVCRRRGVLDTRVGDLNDPPSDQRWRTILLLCGNLGLGGSWEANRRLLQRLAAIAAPGAMLIGDSVNYDGRAEIGLRIRYRHLVTPWWRQRNVAATEVLELVAGTGWTIERQLEDGVDHAVALRRAEQTQTLATHYSVRSAALSDVGFLADVVLAATRSQSRLRPGMDEPEWRIDYCRWTETQIRGEWPGNTTSVIEIDGEPIGRLRVLRTDQTIELAGIQLLSGVQNLGIGTAIIKSLKDEAARAGAVLELGVEKDNPNAHRLYQRLGFTKVGETQDEHRLRWPPTREHT